MTAASTATRNAAAANKEVILTTAIYLHLRSEAVTF